MKRVEFPYLISGKFPPGPWTATIIHRFGIPFNCDFFYSADFLMDKVLEEA